MFVIIENNNMGIAAVDAWIKTERNNNGNVISPDFAMEVLSKTNHRGHIKTVIKNIIDRCKTKEELIEYKEFILSCVDRREQSQQVVDILNDVADVCGIREEFEEANKKDKFYSETDCDKTVVIVKSNEVKDVDLSMYKKVIFEYVGNIKINKSAKLPPICDFSNSRDGRSMHYIDLSFYADLSNVDKLIFGKGDEVVFGVYSPSYSARMNYSVDNYHAYNLHGVIDVSMCSKADFADCSLENVEELKTENVDSLNFDNVRNFFKEYEFKNNKKISFKYAKFDKDVKMVFENVEEVNLGKTNLSGVLDFSGCDAISLDLTYCSFNNVQEMKFKEGGNITIRGNVPDDFDFSLFSEVKIFGCDLSNVKNLKFRDGANVFISKDVFCEGILDVSNCGEVHFSENKEAQRLGDMKYVHKIKFKNEEQMRKSFIKPDYRKFIFEESSIGVGFRRIANMFGGRD